MGQRDDRHHYANRRRRTEKENGGRVFPRTPRAVVVSAYQHSAVIRIAVNGAIVTLPKDRTVADSFAHLDAGA